MEKTIKQELVELFKAEGLELAESSVEMLILAVFKILPVIAARTTNTMDDMVVAALSPILKRELLKLADKINKEDNE